LKPDGKFYNLGLNLTTPPVGPGRTVSQILFSEDGSKLRVSVKGVPLSTTVGFVATWDIAHDGTLSPTYTKTTPDKGDGLLPFGIFNVVGSPNAVLVTDPGLGMTVYDFIQPNTTYFPFAIEGQSRTCWVEYAKTTSSYWLTDSGARKVYEVAVNAKTLKSTLLNSFALANMSDPSDLAVGSIFGKE
jgi:hypothetical protein